MLAEEAILQRLEAALDYKPLFHPAHQSDDLARLQAQVEDLQDIRNDPVESEVSRLLAEKAILMRLEWATGYKPPSHPAFQLYRLTDEELATELKRRQERQPPCRSTDAASDRDYRPADPG